MLVGGFGGWVVVVEVSKVAEVSVEGAVVAGHVGAWARSAPAVDQLVSTTAAVVVVAVFVVEIQPSWVIVADTVAVAPG